ncbi:hypothetical protein [Streptomyces purpurascens]|uniref:hypothetical protein n=1 Tax=Streptomyces purpurascens TaxID=1924 RepID=UPI001676FEB3|nr:hypothetical protein [Streptomyces purpurascens]MCE7049514.1 hypothetical protein [Streptomyces purpurascens]GHA22237.1 hypothetical protein GCM10010303_35930 [Streptomyces purpurascens]
MTDRITIGAAFLMTSLAGAAAIARAWVTPPSSGRHRATAPAPVSLLRPIEALDQFEARCLVERRDTLHVRFRTGDVQCLDCRSSLAGGAR